MRWLLALALLTAPAAAEPVKVVASFSILADLVEEIGGDRVDVTALVPPGGDVHVYEPSPRDAGLIAEADLVVVNGLGFEGFLDRLVDAAGGDVPVVEAGAGARTLPAQAGHDDHAVDPHAWLDAGNARIYVAAIAAALDRVDPDGSAAYAENLARTDAALAALDAELRETLAPYHGDTVLIPHGSMAYFAARYGVAAVSVQGLSSEAEASAAQMGALIRRARDGGVDAVFLEAQGDRRTVEAIAAEAGMPVGPPLYLDTLSPPDGPAPNYLAMMRTDARALTDALAGARR